MTSWIHVWWTAALGSALCCTWAACTSTVTRERDKFSFMWKEVCTKFSSHTCTSTPLTHGTHIEYKSIAVFKDFLSSSCQYISLEHKQLSYTLLYTFKFIAQVANKSWLSLIYTFSHLASLLNLNWKLPQRETEAALIIIICNRLNLKSVRERENETHMYIMRKYADGLLKVKDDRKNEMFQK